MTQGIKVGDVMTRDFVYTHPDTNLLECARIMIKKRVESLILKNKRKLIGVLTERDILWALIKKSKQDLSEIKAKDIAIKKILTIKPDADLKEAFSKMNKKKKRRLLVVLNKNLIGLITLKDIFKTEPSWFESENQRVKIRQDINTEKEVKEGICEECGNYDSLLNVDGKFICESCLDNL